MTIRVRRAVICLISALAHHGLTTHAPHVVDLALSTSLNAEIIALRIAAA